MHSFEDCSGVLEIVFRNFNKFVVSANKNFLVGEKNDGVVILRIIRLTLHQQNRAVLE